MQNINLLPFSDDVVKKLDNLVSVIRSSVTDCCKIVLFGSYARAEYKASSDFDILVLTETVVPREIRGELYSFFEENNSDLVFYTTEAFNDSQALLVRRIKKEGVLLWKG
ncbi:nucleotidyltransferase domain-containing protein [Acetivibrio ethanolgignens]|uniref:Polymerase beta nucleotidyltransferase domain-containing protein n=1 Tax=Acetivibrio ethanolgignens TaxID=290052 RepID=A0A0V8QEC6_9FIRM|nr:nucleotidyltransferase domain-containing protein [Acetivibrio ethanolgignens]KSV58739.1 hypothetical protein ASU35_11795 [Acetivibrio ethanolgignens]